MGTVTRFRRPSRAEVRGRLLEAAERVLVEHGYGAASVEMITDAAGLSRGALYSNFRGKEDLYLALLEEYDRQQAETLGAAFQDNPDLASLLDLLRARGHTAGHNSRAIFTLQAELWLLAMRNEEVRARVVAQQRRNVRAIAKAFEGVNGLPVPPERAAAIVSGLNDGLLMQRLLDPRSMPASFFVDTLLLLARAFGLVPGEEVS